MKWIGWTAAIIAFCLMLYTCALPGDLPADDDTGAGLAGTYTVNGVDPLGVEYSGTVVITATDVTDRYEVGWIVTGGIHEGIGVVDGSTFEVSWAAIASGGGTGSGTATYRIGTDGVLRGTRWITGVAEPGTEEIFPDP